MSNNVSQDPDIEPIDNTDEEDYLFESAMFEARFEDLPSVKEAKAIIAARGYGERDPLNVLIDIYSKFDFRQTSLCNRVLLSTTNNSEAVTKFREAVVEGAKQWQATQDKFDEYCRKVESLEQQNEGMLSLMEKVLPAFNRAGGDVIRAAEMIENRSSKAVILSYLAPAIAFIAGFMACILTR